MCIRDRVDTGGFEPFSKDIILSQMRQQAQLAIDAADVILFVTDIRDGVTAADHEVAAMLQKSLKPVILVCNKVDQGGEPPLAFYEFFNLEMCIRDRSAPLWAGSPLARPPR